MNNKLCRDATCVIRIGESDVGHGLFVTRDMPAGATLLTFHGRIIDFAGTLAKGERECDAFQIGPNMYLDLDAPGVFINHSCDPNTGVRDDRYLVALRDLCEGDEIRFDYSTTMDEDHWTLDCRCGAPGCRGVVRDFKWLEKQRKIELLQQQVVPTFLVMAELAAGRLSSTELVGMHGVPA